MTEKLVSVKVRESTRDKIKQLKGKFLADSADAVFIELLKRAGIRL